MALYRTGHATLSIDGGTPTDLNLDAHGATLFAPGHAGLTWTSADGWYLYLNGPSDATPPEATANLQRDSGDFRGWAGFTSKTCAVAYTDVRSTRIAGSIRCNDLVWYDKSSVENVQPLAVPPFDLDVDFEATGDGTLPTATPALP